MNKRVRKARPIVRRRPAAHPGLTPVQRIEGRILVIRGHRVLLDRDLAAMYGVETGVLLQAVRRNADRFPEDFMFQLTWDEAEASRSQNVILKEFPGKDPPSAGRAKGSNVKYRPVAFTEQGVAMLSSVLRSPRAIKVNIEIMRAFVKLRKLLASHADLARRIDDLEARYDEQFKFVFDAIRMLMTEPEEEEDPKRTPIGFRMPEEPQIEPKPKARRQRDLVR
jgi:ORF6N domain